MHQIKWRDHHLPTRDLELAWFDAGDGPVLIMLNGGPGDDHRYLRPFAEPLTNRFRCVLYDQRGTGESRLADLTADTLHIDRFCEDIEALRAHLQLERVSLVGHSWGAPLALYYGAMSPERVERLVLIGMGPLTDDLNTVAAANLLKPLDAAERRAFQELRRQRREAIEAGKWDQTHHELQIRMVTKYLIRSWIYSPEVRERFAAQYRAGYAHNSFVNRFAQQSLDQDLMLSRLASISAPVLVVYGYQDFEPITQAYLLREHLPQAQIAFINECGHIPWIEQPDMLYQILEDFLA